MASRRPLLRLRIGKGQISRPARTRLAFAGPLNVPGAGNILRSLIMLRSQHCLLRKPTLCLVGARRRFEIRQSRPFFELPSRYPGAGILTAQGALPSSSCSGCDLILGLPLEMLLGASGRFKANCRQNCGLISALCRRFRSRSRR
jgi:hypothetical protein